MLFRSPRCRDLADGGVVVTAEGGRALPKQVGHDGQRLLVAPYGLVHREPVRLSLSTCVTSSVTENEPTSTYLVDGLGDAYREARVTMQRRKNPCPDVDRRRCLGDRRCDGDCLPPPAVASPIISLPLQFVVHPDGVESHLSSRDEIGRAHV